jgi:uncharacterized membrane protein
MIEAHTFDAWTRAADRPTSAYRDFMILGGFAAPLFLFLAGLAVPFAGRASLKKSGSRRTAAASVISRGLVVFILAFAFRLQTFIVTPGNSLLSIFRVDILNVMGPALAVSAAVWAACAAPAACASAMALGATAIALATPVVRAAAWVDAMPVWIQWYLRPAGEFTTFTLFPWAGFVFAGAALGAVLANAPETTQHRLMGAAGATGVVLIAAGLYAATLPSLYASSSFWTTSPTYFAVRVGIMMSLLFLLFAADSLSIGKGQIDPLQRLGQRSLFVYWIHVELVYGYASWLWRRRLPLAVTCVGYVAFAALMYGAVVLRDRVARPKPWTRTRFRDAPADAVTVP